MTLLLLFKEPWFTDRHVGFRMIYLGIPIPRKGCLAATAAIAFRARKPRPFVAPPFDPQAERCWWITSRFDSCKLHSDVDAYVVRVSLYIHVETRICYFCYDLVIHVVLGYFTSLLRSYLYDFLIVFALLIQRGSSQIHDVDIFLHFLVELGISNGYRFLLVCEVMGLYDLRRGPRGFLQNHRRPLGKVTETTLHSTPSASRSEEYMAPEIIKKEAYGLMVDWSWNPAKSSWRMDLTEDVEVMLMVCEGGKYSK